MEFKRTGCYDVMYKKIEEIGWKENRGIQNVVGTVDSKSNIIKIRDKY
jgi:hypothetical protein